MTYFSSIIARELKASQKPEKRPYKKRKQQRGQSDSKVKTTKEKKRNSSPLVNNKAAKKVKLDFGKVKDFTQSNLSDFLI